MVPEIVLELRGEERVRVMHALIPKAVERTRSRFW
jgi:hypothetical protein